MQNKEKRTILHISFTVWVCVFVYTLVMIVMSSVQYRYDMYNAFDLGIFDQVLWNSVHGRLFEYSFNDYSYLVDHREWILLLLAPLYAVVQHPITLLIIQSVVLGSGAIPFYLLSQKVFITHTKHSREIIGIIAAIVYVFNPSVQAMNFFEFHVLPFAIPLALWLWWYIEQNSFWGALCSFVLLLLVREECALMIVGLGILMLIERKTLIWKSIRITGAHFIVISVLWFLLMSVIGAQFAPEGEVKFFYFYTWLGDTPWQAIQFMLLHPLQTIGIMFGKDHLSLLFLFFACVFFFPLFRLRYILPAILPLILYLLIDKLLVISILKAHYSATIIPWFFIAALYGYAAFEQKIQSIQKKEWAKQYDLRLYFIVTCIVWYGSMFVIFGPWWNMIHSFSLAAQRDRIVIHRIIREVQPNDGIMTTDGLYPRLSRRRALYPAMHLFKGKKHFSEQLYTLPTQSIDWIFLEYSELLRYGTIFSIEERQDAWKRLQQIVQQNQLAVIESTEDLVVFGKPTPKRPSLLPIVTSDRTPLQHEVHELINNDIWFEGWNYASVNATQGELTLAFTKEKESKELDDAYIRLQWNDTQQKVIKEKIFALGFGIYPSHAWQYSASKYIMVTVPVVSPQEGVALSISIGPVKQEVHSGFWFVTAESNIDTERAVTLLLSGMTPY
ncbi:MAG TPA: DUF2079 domain-containing protein [Patescibacteria group bacterium]|nr:DUF2079 domain-containing protein [Patescibacteria group bacterium]